MYTILLVLGIALAAFGGDRFVRGAVGISVALRIPAGIIGATVAAFATSSPELSVSVISALEGDPELALGDAAGSNMVNLGVVLGLTVMLVSVTARWVDIRRELPVAVGALGLVALVISDGVLGRGDALAMLSLFFVWLTWVVFDARRERSAAGAVIGDTNTLRSTLDLVVGLVLLVVAGRLIVLGAKEVGEVLGWDEFLVGAVLVAIGTSTPELVTALVAARRGHAEVGVGTVLGSNIFNTLLIVGAAGLIEPIDASSTLIMIAIGAGFVVTIAAVPNRHGSFSRFRGLVLLLVYAGYLGALFVWNA
jgi:cation:H+ antiporter